MHYALFIMSNICKIKFRDYNDRYLIRLELLNQICISLLYVYSYLHSEH